MAPLTDEDQEVPVRGVPMRAVCLYSLSFVLGAGGLAGSAVAQFNNGSQATELKLPTRSQRSIVTQQIGLTNITINYCRPLAAGRTLFGKEIPYGQVWRTGANDNTTIAVTDEVSVEGHPLPAGTYGLHMIPKPDEWIVIFSKNSTSWGSFTYDEKEDALRVTVKPNTAEMQEALEFNFEDVKPDSTAVIMRWATLAVPFRISVDVNAIVVRSIQNQLRNVGGFSWAGYDEAANWLLDSNANLDQALKWSDQSILAEERFDNLLTKSQILEAQGKKQEAAATKAKAFDLASGIQLHSYGRGLQFQKRQDEGFAVFQINVKKHPNEWYTHGELARMASAKGDFATATKEMNLALASAPDVAKPGIKGLLARLAQKQDINP
jgi:tetratricopeptide (TPR) repeat protein